MSHLLHDETFESLLEMIVILVAALIRGCMAYKLAVVGLLVDNIQDLVWGSQTVAKDYIEPLEDMRWWKSLLEHALDSTVSSDCPLHVHTCKL